jgi:hypothetical protein
MSSTSIERGDIVRIKPEWLDAGENAELKYVVLQDNGTATIAYLSEPSTQVCHYPR